MQRELTSWYSNTVNREMPIACYGHYGFSLLLVPTAGADYLEYERFQMMDDLAPIIDSGKVKVFSIDSLNKESWLNNEMDPHHKAIRHHQWNDYVYNEVIPFIKSKTSNETPIIISGASFGALHSANLFFRRPDLLDGFIAMSGVYDLTEYTKGYFDMKFISTVHVIICRTLLITKFWSRFAGASIYIFSPAAVITKIRTSHAVLPMFSTAKALPMNLTFGEKTLSTIGQHGERCCLFTCKQDFELSFK